MNVLKEPVYLYLSQDDLEAEGQLVSTLQCVAVSPEYIWRTLGGESARKSEFRQKHEIPEMRFEACAS
jgi:hypothetical protein